MLLGHEGAGTIEAVGDGVDGARTAATASCSAGRPPAANARLSCAASRVSASDRRLRPGRLLRDDGAELTPVLRTGTFATHTVVPQVAAVKVPRELPVEQACLIGCAVATGVMSVLETANVWAGRPRRGDRLRCGRALGRSRARASPGAAEIRAIDLDERKLEQATRFGATDAATGPVDFVFDVVGAPLHRSSSALVAARDRVARSS